MNSAEKHLSRAELEALRTGESECGAARLHLESCRRCRFRLARLVRDDRFLERFRRLFFRAKTQ